MNENVEFTNLCMVRDGDRVLVIDRKKEDWPGITFPGGHEGRNWLKDCFSPDLWNERLGGRWHSLCSSLL